MRLVLIYCQSIFHHKLKREGEEERIKRNVLFFISSRISHSKLSSWPDLSSLRKTATLKCDI